ncbi:hypothetical protein D910_11015 [Dendroctonus ponderosae]
MVFRAHLYIAAMLMILLIHKAKSLPYLDPVDECILTCDACYKGEFLLDCANDCIFQSGDVGQPFKNHCPQFDMKLPSVQMV